MGLLNIGSEEIKGNEVVKKAGELLRKSPLNFHGNVEGDDIYKGTTDVVVCDGFVGNVALKTSEGLAKMLGDFLKEEYTRSIFTRLAARGLLPGHQALPPPRGPPALQRRRAPGPARHRGEEPRLRRPPRVRTALARAASRGAPRR